LFRSCPPPAVWYAVDSLVGKGIRVRSSGRLFFRIIAPSYLARRERDGVHVCSFDPRARRSMDNFRYFYDDTFTSTAPNVITIFAHRFADRARSIYVPRSTTIINSVTNYARGLVRPFKKYSTRFVPRTQYGAGSFRRPNARNHNDVFGPVSRVNVL